MSERAVLWIISALVVALFGLVGVIYASVRSSHGRTERRVDAHIEDDVAAHERIVRLETKVDRIEEEVRTLRDRWHSLREHVLNEIWPLLKDRIETLKADVQRMIGK